MENYKTSLQAHTARSGSFSFLLLLSWFPSGWELLMRRLVTGKVILAARSQVRDEFVRTESVIFRLPVVASPAFFPSKRRQKQPNRSACNGNSLLESSAWLGVPRISKVNHLPSWEIPFQRRFSLHQSFEGNGKNEHPTREFFRWSFLPPSLSIFSFSSAHNVVCKALSEHHFPAKWIRLSCHHTRTVSLSINFGSLPDDYPSVAHPSPSRATWSKALACNR